MTKIRVLVPVISGGPRNPEDFDAMKLPGVTISSAFISSGPSSIESRVDEVFCVSGLIPLARQAEAEGVNALVIDCMLDPGLAALREAVGIPVLGVAQTAMSTATNLARKFGIVTVLDRITPLMDELSEVYGHSQHYVGCRSIGVPVLEIHDDLEKVKSALAKAAIGLAQDRGAAAIILGCTGFFGCAEFIRAQLLKAGFDIPVIDPMPTAVAVAAAFASRGLSHSRVSYPAV